MMKPVAVKLPLSLVMLAVATMAFVWRFTDPGVMIDAHGIRLLYPVLVFLLAPMVSVIGWFGATMTFPIEKD